MAARRRVVPRALAQSAVVDVEEASRDPKGCGPYACALLTGQTFAEMRRWFADHAATRGGGVHLDAILRCLEAHGRVATAVAVSGPLHRLASHSTLADGALHLLVSTDHVVTLCDGNVNERRRGGWVSPTLCKNRRIDCVYRVDQRRGGLTRRPAKRAAPSP